LAVIHLGTLGYRDFRILNRGKGQTPDFAARLDDKEARIEVKNLREPKDIVRTVASSEWKRLVKSSPQKYNFGVMLRHSHRGQLSLAAQTRLCTLLNQLPKSKRNPIDEVLDGGVEIRIERLDEPVTRPSRDELPILP
jgi:hypothetical protein